MFERPRPSPRFRTAASRFARAAAVHNGTFRPAPVVFARALAEVVSGGEATADEGGPADREREGPRTATGRRRRESALAAWSTRAVLSVVTVGACVGVFADPAVAPGREAGVGGASASALSALWSYAEASRSAGTEPTLDVARPASTPVPDSALVAGLHRRAAALRRRPAVPPGLPVGAPVAGPVSSPFGPRRHPVTRRVRNHRGTDFAVPLRTPVRATSDGRVLSVGRRPGYGLTVELEHRDPSGLETTPLYAHLDAADVAEGAPVRRGNVVGLSGGVGPGAGLSTGPHVHYEVRERLPGRAASSARAVDPAVLYDRVRSWGAETVRQRRALTSAARALAARAQAEGGAPTTVSRTALLSDR